MHAGIRFGFTLWLGALLATHSPPALSQSIDFTDFGAGKGLTLNGAATVASAGDKKVLRVTPNQELQAGSAFLTEKVALKDGFETIFTFQITDTTGGGADGFAFVIQNSDAKALGSTGSGLGYGISTDGDQAIGKSLAIEFDTFTLKDLGAEAGEDLGDPNGNHISVHSRGPQPNSIDEAYSLGKVAEGLPSFKDGKPHNVKIDYAPGSMKIFVDNMDKTALTVALKLDSFSGKDFKDASVLDADGKAWVGFTAGTGSLTENHDILSWKLTPQKPAGG
jgi:legume-like lectin family protein